MTSSRPYRLSSCASSRRGRASTSCAPDFPCATFRLRREQAPAGSQIFVDGVGAILRRSLFARAALMFRVQVCKPLHRREAHPAHVPPVRYHDQPWDSQNFPIQNLDMPYPVAQVMLPNVRQPPQSRRFRISPSRVKLGNLQAHIPVPTRAACNHNARPRGDAPFRPPRTQPFRSRLACHQRTRRVSHGS